MATSRPLSPATRRFVSWLLLLSATLLTLGMLLQLYVVVYIAVQRGLGALYGSQVAALALGLATAAVLGYYGWQLRQPAQQP